MATREDNERTALDNYNSAAQFNATSLVVVVFGQFAILTLLESKAALLWTLPVQFLVGVYYLIIFLGCYFILNYLKFALFIEELGHPKYTGVHPLAELEKELIGDIEGRSPLVASLSRKRGSILKECNNLDVIACLVYVAVSVLILLAALRLPMLAN